MQYLLQPKRAESFLQTTEAVESRGLARRWTRTLVPPQVQNHCHMNSHLLKRYAQVAEHKRVRPLAMQYPWISRCWVKEEKARKAMATRMVKAKARKVKTTKGRGQETEGGETQEHRRAQEQEQQKTEQQKVARSREQQREGREESEKDRITGSEKSVKKKGEHRRREKDKRKK